MWNFFHSMENYQPAIMGAPVATCLKHSLQLTVRISQNKITPKQKQLQITAANRKPKTNSKTSLSFFG